MSKKTHPLYEFGPFRLDTTERLLTRAGEAVALTPKAFETLVVLVERRGRLIGKDEPMGALWPGSAVEEANLTNNVYALRKAMGEGRDGRHYIETVPKHGYRFVADVTEVLDTRDEMMVEKHSFTRIVTEVAEVKDVPRGARLSMSLKAAAACLLLLVIGSGALVYRPWAWRETEDAEAVATGASTPRTIAVLPLKVIGAEGGSEHFGIGMSDALITSLDNSRQVMVRPTSAVRKYADPSQDPVAAGRQQKVDVVLDGTIQRAGDRIRVTVQLLRVHDGVLIWSGQFDERFTDIFDLQDSISQRVMRELMLNLGDVAQQRPRKRETLNVEAYEIYLEGLYFWNKRTRDGYRRAVECFGRAVELDPTYARAYVGLGNAYAYLGGSDPASQAEAISKQRAAARKALELDETLSEAHAILGLIAMNSDWDWAEAEWEFKRAIELNPNYATARAWYGEFLAGMGRFDEGVAEIRRAHELDPLSPVISTDVAKVYLLARRYDEAVGQFEKTLEADPEFEVARGLLALTYSLEGRHEEAIGELRKIKGLEGNPMYLSFLGYVYGVGGRKHEARGVLGRLVALSKRTYVSPLWLTVVCAGLGEKDQAFEWFEKVFEERSVGGAIPLRVNPLYDSLRTDRRFPALLRRARFEP